MKLRSSWISLGLVCLCVALVPTSFVGAQSAASRRETNNVSLSPELRKQLTASLDKAAAYLRQQQQPDGMWEKHPGISGLAATALLRMPGEKAAQLQVVGKTLDEFVKMAKPDGGIYEKAIPHYITAVSVGALTAGGRPQDRPMIEKARVYLAEHLLDEGEGVKKDDKLVRRHGLRRPRHRRPPRGHHQPRVRAARDEGSGPSSRQRGLGEGVDVPAAHAEQQRDQRSEVGGQRRRLRLLPRVHVSRRTAAHARTAA